MTKFSNKTRTVLLAGASGYIGKQVETKLRNSGYRVLSIYRKGHYNAKNNQKNNIEVEFKDPKSIENFRQKCPSIDIIISCVASRTGGKLDSWAVDFGVNNILLNLALEKKVKQFILLSAICVQKPMVEFQQAKLAFETLLLKSKLRYSIVRPTAFFKSLSGQIDRIRLGKKFILFDQGENTLCKPISENDTANYILACITNENLHNKILPIGGSTVPISSRTIGEIMFSALDKKPKFKSVPSRSFRIAEKALSPVALFSKKIQDLQEFLRIANYYATQSMLCWNQETQSYDPDITPEYGNDTLEEHFQKLASNNSTEDHGSHKLF